MPKYDYLIAGAGIFGATFARYLTDHGKKCLVIDRRDHIAGNIYTKKIEGIDVHMYGGHTFHTSHEPIWRFVNRFSDWIPFKYNPRVRVGDKVYSFPVNLLTFHQLWGVTTPKEAYEKLRSVQIPCRHPRNAEEWLLSQVGREIYEKFFYGYTKKQWLKEPRELPASIVKRLPIRLTHNDSYFQSKYQAIPKDSYTTLVANMLRGIDVELGTDFFKLDWPRYAKKLMFTGPIDKFYDFRFGRLEYRALEFRMEIVKGDFQGHAVFNYPDLHVPYIRTVEHKHFRGHMDPSKYITGLDEGRSVVTYDYPLPAKDAEGLSDPQYPIRDDENAAKYEQYHALSKRTPDILFGGRLGEYKYLDMDQAIGSALNKAHRELLGENVRLRRDALL